MRQRTDVQNIDLMNSCRLLPQLPVELVRGRGRTSGGLPVTRDEARQMVYGMPYEDWKAKYQSGPAKPHDTKHKH